MMHELEIADEARTKVSSAVLVSGSARSGTTIMGKLIHSFEGFEYAFEPPLLFSLIPLLKRIPDSAWRLIYETYLYEDFYLNALAGRNLNLNEQDDSSVYHAKTQAEISARLSRSLQKKDVVNRAASNRIAYKSPDIVPFIPTLQELYPDTTVVVMIREPIATINSLLAKKWFSPENDGVNLIWPFKVRDGRSIPFWVRYQDETLWLSMTETDRCAYYYLRMMDSQKRINNCIKVNYDMLVASPHEMTAYVAKSIGARFGRKTRDVIDTIKPPSEKKDHMVLRRLSAEIKDKIEPYLQ